MGVADCLRTMANFSSFQKLSTGTGDTGQFLLSFRGHDDLITLHSYGLHKVPHLGKYMYILIIIIVV